MDDLASLADVAAALGLSDESELSDSQRTRAIPLLHRISGLFAREAQRDFVPGTATNRLRVMDREVRLSEVPTSVTSVTDDEGNVVEDYAVRGNQLRFASRHEFDFVTVVYVHDADVPPEVSATVAAIVARWISLDTSLNPAVGLSKDLTADGFRQTFADWTMKAVHLSPEDMSTARWYRYPSPAMVVGT